jgi:hypothetical protein
MGPAQLSYLLILLDLVEEHFRGFGGREWAVEQCVVVKQQHGVHLSIGRLELLKD